MAFYAARLAVVKMGATSIVSTEEDVGPLQGDTLSRPRYSRVSISWVRPFEPRCEKTGLRGFQPGLAQTRLYSLRRRLETRNFGFRKKRDCTIYVGNTKALISFAVTAKLICVFVFAYAKSPFSHDAAHLFSQFRRLLLNTCEYTFTQTDQCPCFVFYVHVRTSSYCSFSINLHFCINILIFSHQTDQSVFSLV